jgi:hypothetical protein
MFSLLAAWLVRWATGGPGFILNSNSSLRSFDIPPRNPDNNMIKIPANNTTIITELTLNQNGKTNLTGIFRSGGMGGWMGIELLLKMATIHLLFKGITTNVLYNNRREPYYKDSLTYLQ